MYVVLYYVDGRRVVLPGFVSTGQLRLNTRCQTTVTACSLALSCSLESSDVLYICLFFEHELAAGVTRTYRLYTYIGLT